MRAEQEHSVKRPTHLLACGAAGLLVVAAIVFSIPILAVVGALMCGAMMIGMVWMMLAMAKSRQ